MNRRWRAVWATVTENRIQQLEERSAMGGKDPVVHAVSVSHSLSHTELPLPLWLKINKQFLSTSTPSMDTCAHIRKRSWSPAIPLKTHLLSTHTSTVSQFTVAVTIIANLDSPPLSYLLRSLILHKLPLCEDNKPCPPSMRLNYIQTSVAIHLWWVCKIAAIPPSVSTAKTLWQSRNVVLCLRLLKPSGKH